MCHTFQDGIVLTLIRQVIDELGVLAVLVGQGLPELKDGRRDSLSRMAPENPLDRLHAGTWC